MKIIFERKDLRPRFSDKPSADIRIRDFQDIAGVHIFGMAMLADRIEFHDGERVFVLKDRHGMLGAINDVRNDAAYLQEKIPASDFLPLRVGCEYMTRRRTKAVVTNRWIGESKSSYIWVAHFNQDGSQSRLVHVITSGKCAGFDDYDIVGLFAENKEDTPSRAPFQHVKWSNGSECWYKGGQLHRDGDEPAVINPDGSKYWYKNGHLHREGDLPAFVSAVGDKHWYKNGRLHREGDLPTVVRADGSKIWHRNGMLHREGDLPAVIDPDGTKHWYRDGMRYDPSKCYDPSKAAPQAVQACSHEFVNVGFTSVTMACKHCGAPK